MLDRFELKPYCEAILREGEVETPYSLFLDNNQMMLLYVLGGMDDESTGIIKVKKKNGREWLFKGNDKLSLKEAKEILEGLVLS